MDNISSVQLFILKIPDSVSLIQIDHFHHILPKSEIDKARKMVFPADKRRQIISSYFLRWQLGKLLGLSPVELTIHRDAHGKPFLPNKEIEFNLSHSDEYVVLATDKKELGVDIEKCRNFDVMEIADSFFSDREIASLRELNVIHQKKRFFQLWSAKESIIKAEGKGLSIPLDSFSVSFKSDSAYIEQSNLNTKWRLENWEIDSEYYLTVALNSNDSVIISNISFDDVLSS